MAKAKTADSEAGTDPESNFHRLTAVSITQEEGSWGVTFESDRGEAWDCGQFDTFSKARAEARKIATHLGYTVEIVLRRNGTALVAGRVEES